MKLYRILTGCILCIMMYACGDDTPETEEVTDASCYIFDADTAYHYTQKQVDMGPRIPGTPVQRQCAQWLEQVLTKYADEVVVQRTQVTVGNKNLPCINIIGSFMPDVKDRILLVAHWDTRPWADKEDKSKKIDGADDGASGVGVLLEIARQIQGKIANIGVDILLVDVEDYGQSDEENSYCKGAQYWSANPHVPGYRARMGILLDMVGGAGNQFFEEMYSKNYAQQELNLVWNTGNRLGYGNLFKYNTGMGVTDDHYYINTIAKIPTIDILGQRSETEFPAHHHTTADNMSIIDKNTLKAVGQTVLQVLCNENQKAGEVL